jgi:hypothetical protein
MTSLLADLRKKYHRAICTDLLGVAIRKQKGSDEVREFFNNADGSSPYSRTLAKGMAEGIGGPFCPSDSLPSPQASGTLFANHTNVFLRESFDLLHRLRPGRWTFSTSQGVEGITAYDQYSHLADLVLIRK